MVRNTSLKMEKRRVIALTDWTFKKSGNKTEYITVKDVVACGVDNIEMSKQREYKTLALKMHTGDYKKAVDLLDSGKLSVVSVSITKVLGEGKGVYKDEV